MNAACGECPVAESVAGQRSAAHVSDRTAIPGLARRDLVEALAPVTPSAEGQSDGLAAMENRFARVALSTAIEPGDLDAGWLVEAVGP